jgi:hypothetical protein
VEAWSHSRPALRSEDALRVGAAAEDALRVDAAAEGVLRVGRRRSGSSCSSVPLFLNISVEAVLITCFE